MGIAQRLTYLFASLSDRLMEASGYVPEDRCIEVFGGIPELEPPGIIASTAETVLAPGRVYVKLGPFEPVYRRILEAAGAGEDVLVLGSDDFNGPSGLAYYIALKRRQESARESGTPCMITGIELEPGRFLD